MTKYRVTSRSQRINKKKQERDHVCNLIITFHVRQLQCYKYPVSLTASNKASNKRVTCRDINKLCNTPLSDATPRHLCGTR